MRLPRPCPAATCLSEEAHMGSRRTCFAVLAVMVAMLSNPTADAQSTDGRLSGVVRDASGAAVPGAAVTITNQGTNAAPTVTSGADGSFSARVLPGTYTGTAPIKGFGTQTRRDIKIHAGPAESAELPLPPNRQQK